MTNPDETIKFDITEPGPDTIEARSSDGEIISGMTWDEFEKRIAQSTEFREALEMEHIMAIDIMAKQHSSALAIGSPNFLYLVDRKLCHP